MSGCREGRHLKNTEVKTHPNALVELHLLLVIVLRVEGVETDAVVNKLLPDLLRDARLSAQELRREFHRRAYLVLERISLLERQGVRLCDDGDNVDDLAELLHDDDINRAEGAARGVDEEERAVDTRVLDVTVALRGELLAEVGAVLVLDVLHDRVPATRHMEDASRRGYGG